MAEINGNGHGVPWKNLAIWALGAILTIVSWEWVRSIERADAQAVEHAADHTVIAVLQNDVTTIKSAVGDMKDQLGEIDRKQDAWREAVYPIILRQNGPPGPTFPQGQQFDNPTILSKPRK